MACWKAITKKPRPPAMAPRNASSAHERDGLVVPSCRSGRAFVLWAPQGGGRCCRDQCGGQPEPATAFISPSILIAFLQSFETDISTISSIGSGQRLAAKVGAWMRFLATVICAVLWSLLRQRERQWEAAA